MLPRPRTAVPVGHHRDEIPAHGEVARFVRILRDRGAGEGDAGRVGEREVALRDERLGRGDLDLPRNRLAVILEGAFFQVVVHPDTLSR
jgi:hypothetical protein